MFRKTLNKSAETDNPTKVRNTPPPLQEGVAVFDCLSGQTHILGASPLTFGVDPVCDIQLGAYGFTGGTIQLSQTNGRIQATVKHGNPLLEINGGEFKGGFLPESEEWSFVIDKVGFFLIKAGPRSKEWVRKLESSSREAWSLHIFDNDGDFRQWKKDHCPHDFPGMLVKESMEMLEMIGEVGRRNWGDQVGVIYRVNAEAGFFASQFRALSQPRVLQDAGVHRCPRCWMRFNTTNVLAIHPSELNDGPEGLGEEALKRFIPKKFGDGGTPLTGEGVPCNRLACPHCRGELPPSLIEKAPHMLSIVGDSMAGKSYFLTVAVRQLKRILPGHFKINFTDADPAGNDVLARMMAKLFNPSQKPEDTFLEKTELAGATYRSFKRHGANVNLPMPFTYNMGSKSHGSSTIVLYDNAGEHFRPGYSEREKSNSTEHLAWSSGIVFLFDPLQHRDLLVQIGEETDPQVKEMKESGLRFDQDVILAEIAERLRAWRQLSVGQAHDVPLAFVVGKHDLLTKLLPLDSLTMDVCQSGKITMEAIESNSEVTRSFLLKHCPDIVGAAESISDRVMYFPTSAFGSPAIALTGIKTIDGKVQFGPDPKKLRPYLVEAPFLWILSQAEPSLFGVGINVRFP
jgi:hypothetical protein